MSYDSEAYYQSARKQALKYTHIIYIPPMFEPVDDGFRWTDKDYQKQMDRLIKAALFDWHLLERTYTIKSLDTDNRIAEVYAWLKEHS